MVTNMDTEQEEKFSIEEFYLGILPISENTVSIPALELHNPLEMIKVKQNKTVGKAKSKNNKKKTIKTKKPSSDEGNPKKRADSEQENVNPSEKIAKRGRPRKSTSEESSSESQSKPLVDKNQVKRGRPKKNKDEKTEMENETLTKSKAEAVKRKSTENNIIPAKSPRTSSGSPIPEKGKKKIGRPKKKAEENFEKEVTKEKGKRGRPKTKSNEAKEEVLKPEDCQITAKRGTLKYLRQREEFVKAVVKDAQVEDDFFSSKASQKNFLGNLLLSSSLDDSLTIKTPVGKGKQISSTIITPRTMKLGQWASDSPWCEPMTPSTNSPGPEKEALDVIYHHIKGRKRWNKPIREVLSESNALSQSVSTKYKPPMELPSLPEIPDGNNGDSSDDDYFNDSNHL